MFDLIREIGQNLRRNRVRTALTGFAVAWGIFMLVVLLSFAQGTENHFKKDMSSQDMSSLNAYGGITKLPYKGLEVGRWVRLTDNDIEAVKANDSKYVDEVIAMNSNDTATISTSKNYQKVSLQGVTPDEIRMGLRNVKFMAGRFINRFDMNHRRKVIAISAKDASLLFGSPEEAIGSTLSSMGLTWTVVGVFEREWGQTAYVPYTTLKMLTGNNPYVEKLTILAKNLNDETDSRQVTDNTFKTLAKTHMVNPQEGPGGGIYVWNRFDNYLQAQKGMRMLSMATWIIGLLTMLSGVVGISNIMFVSVKERTHEIGIRRAIGARPRQILVSILAESVAITTLFGYIGIVLGLIVVVIAGPIGVEKGILYKPGITLATAFEVLAVLIVAGALAGFFPALKATKVKPVEALRDE